MAGRKKVEEEVKVEKKFCTKCGRELNEGEVCNCTEKKTEVNINADAILDYAKEFGNTIIDMFKTPEDTLDKKLKDNRLAHDMILLVVLALSLGLYVAGTFSSIIDMLGSLVQVNIANFISIPYFKIFLFVFILEFVLTFIPIGVAFLGNKVFKGKAITFKQAISLYAVSFAPTILSNLLMFITNYFNILGVIGTIIGVVVSICCFFHFILGYLKISEFKVNLKAYALTAVIVVYTVLYMAVMGSCLTNFVKGMAKDLDINNNDSYFDRLDW